MPHYLFIPGGRRKKEDWDAVRDILEPRGWQTGAITLSDPEHSTLTEHISQVVGHVSSKDLTDVHLVGHSYGSFVITGAAAAIPERIAGLVFVDAAVPRSGQSLFDIFAEAGVKPGKYWIPGWPPFKEPISFDEEVIKNLPKRYINCLQSQFFELNAGFARQVQQNAERDNWDYQELDTEHYCMIKDPEQLAAALSG